MGWKDAPVENVTSKPAWDSAPLADEQPIETVPQRTLPQQLARQAGLTARIGIEGLSDLGGMAVNAASKLGDITPMGLMMNAAGERFIPNYAENKQAANAAVSGGGTRVSDILGLPKPETSTERVVNEAGRAMVPAGGVIKGANIAANTATSLAKQRIARFLAAAPAQQLAGAAGAGLGSSTAREMGAGEGGQLAAGIAGGLGAAAGASTINKAFNTASLGMHSPDLSGKTSLKQRNAQAAINEGYVLPPSNTESGIVSRTLEGVSGKEKTLQLASVKNQQVTDNLAKDYLKIPRDVELNAQTLQAAKEPYNNVYEQIASLPAVKRVGKLADGKESLTGKQALESLKKTRYDSRVMWEYFNRSGDPEAMAKANILDEQAKSMERNLESIAMGAKKPELVQELRNARKELAKIYTVEKSLNPETGNVDAKVILKLKQKGAPIDGALGKVAKTAEAFPDAMRVPKAGYSNPFTAWDATFGALGAGVSTPALVMPAARVGARYGVLSKAGQRAINMQNKTPPPASILYGLGAVDEGND